VIVEVNEEREEEPVMAIVHDPVCGMDIDPAAAAGSEEFEGTTYYFCSPSCLERFKADLRGTRRRQNAARFPTCSGSWPPNVARD
jgi:Cu+-exporting ATPase